jgi:flagellar hook-associated protein 1 FlgK
MSGLFGIIHLGLSALLSHRSALNVRSHNLANVDTPGYSRQEALLATNPPWPSAGTAEALIGGQFGTGVDVLTVRRAREGFLDFQTRICQGLRGQADSAAGALRQIESILAPAPEQNLSTLLDRFWDDWENVANRPEDLGLRYVLRETALTVADTFRDYVQRIHSVILTVDTGISARIQEVNTLTAQIADYNRQITVAQAEGRAPNDLLDSRGLLLDRLAQLTGALPAADEAGHLIIHLDGRPIVQDAAAYSLSLAGAGQILSSYDDASVQITNGEIGGLLEARNIAIPSYLADLDTLATTLVAQVNTLHQAGFGLDGLTGRDFFLAGATAGDLALDPALLADVRAIAAAAADVPGDGSVALQIANLRTTPVLAGRTLNESTQSLLGVIGNDIATRQNAVTAQEFALDQIRQQQQSISGVSIDEELTYLTLSQRAYEAAARIVSTVDDMLVTVIERMGVS